MKRPDFFMIGAPKCGTSAMATYLGTNPEVFFCRPREPFFWADDFPKQQRYFGVTTLEKYLKLFETAEENHRAVGEKSTCYLASKTAVPRILEFNNSAKLLVMLRNPVRMAQSWHGEMLVNLNEDTQDFEAAWNLQERRLQGHNIPPLCLEAAFLQYREMACYVKQLEPVVNAVDADRLKIVILEEFVAEPRQHYSEICKFLGVKDDGRTQFPPVRESHRHVFPALSKMIMRPPSWLEPAAILVRRRGHQKQSGIISFAKKFLRRKEKRQVIRPEFEQHLSEVFASDITRLEHLLGRSLSLWQNDTATRVKGA